MPLIVPFNSRSIWLSLIAVWLVSLELAAASKAPAPARPNILLILTDDQGLPTLSCYGNTLLRTPHLDRLAEEGVRFTDAYVTPQCTPTRATLFTGQYTARSGLWRVLPGARSPYGEVWEPEFREALPREAFTLPKALRAAGYVTGMAGKWHLTANVDGDYNALNSAAAAAYGFDSVAPPGPGSSNVGDKHVDHLTDQAIAFARRHRAQPWFFYLSHYTVHGKVSAPTALVERYRERGAPESGLHNATYLAALEHLDNSIGRLMTALDELGLRERTLVVFLSDNGGVSQRYDPRPFMRPPPAGSALPTQLEVDLEEFSNAPLRMGKGSHYEGGIRVPCVVRWPGVVPPRLVSEYPIHVVDWLPTLLAAAGGRMPGDAVADGIDLRPVLEGRAGPERALFWYMPFYEVRWGATPAAIVRQGDWKLIEFFGGWFDPQGRLVPGPRTELYNLRRDVGETRDLAPEQPERVAAMTRMLRDWLHGTGAPVPGRNPDFDPARQLQEVPVRRASPSEATGQVQ